MTWVDKQLHDGIMLNPYNVISRQTCMTSVNTQTTYFYIYRYIDRCPGVPVVICVPVSRSVISSVDKHDVSRQTTSWRHNAQSLQWRQSTHKHDVSQQTHTNKQLMFIYIDRFPLFTLITYEFKYNLKNPFFCTETLKKTVPILSTN